MRIGFVMTGPGIGDSIIALKALYEAKRIYNAETIILGGGNIENLLRFINFIDKIIYIANKNFVGFLDADSIKNINEYPCDYLILGKAKSSNMKLLKQCNAKKIIAPMKFYTIFARKFRSVPLYFVYKNYMQMGRGEIFCALLRTINPKLYDSKISSLDYHAMRIPTTPQNKAFVAEFLESETKKLIESSSQQTQHARYYILVNLFNITNPHTLNPNSWLNLILQLSHIQDTIIVIPTYEAVHDNFIQNLKEFQKTSNNNQEIPNLIIFKNNNDILNLVALVEQMSLVIAPSTGTIHIASNLDIPTIGIYSLSDTTRWKSKDERYVILENPKYTITPQEEEIAITQVIALTKELLQSQKISPKILQ